MLSKHDIHSPNTKCHIKEKLTVDGHFFLFLSKWAGFGRISWQMDQTLNVLLCKTRIKRVAVTSITVEHQDTLQTEQHLTVLALYLSPGYDQEQHESNTDCAKPKREEQQRSSQNRNAV